MSGFSQQQRLDELKADYQKGLNQLKALEMQEADLRQTLLRISGAIQVLEETLAKDGNSTPAGPTSDDGQTGHA